MLKKIRVFVLFLLVSVLSVNIAAIGSNVGTAEEAVVSNVVKENGFLQVKNGQLCNEKGEPIQLKGMSSHGLNACMFTKNTIKFLVRDWNITVIRAAMYSDGYIQNPGLMRERMRLMVDKAIEHGIYILIDWHILRDGNPNKHKELAKEFFEEMATAYGKYPNVIYEICNEPNGVTWEEEIKPYAEYIIPVIRAIDPDNIIIVGTDTWSQGVHDAAQDPLDYSNIMYALHFYSGSHGQELRDKAEIAMSEGLALFVTEFGITNATGGGRLYLEEAEVWMDWMKKNKISWCNWSFSNFAEDSAALEFFTGMNGPWKDSQISESGLWVRSKIME